MADQIEEVKAKTDIVALISEHVDLKKAGRNYKGLCPFHNEKTPSFMVTPELQMYKCFGCGVSGDAFTFLEEYEGMEFSEALKYLAEKGGVTLLPLKGKGGGDKERLFSINLLAMQFYQYILWKHKEGREALNYLLDNRELKPETIKEFKLGYSPNTPFALKSFLIDKKKFDIKSVELAGIVYRGDRGVFDRFRGRVIFPLFDHRGNTVGFAGRTLPGARSDLAKYINTPETPIYHKSNLLFGLNSSKAEIKRKKTAIVVEGELDMISSWQAGIKNVIAIKGSALTEEQIKLLSRYAANVVLALDADLAGDAAARRGIEIAEKGGMEVKVAVLTKFKDPDEAARKDPESLKKCFAEAKNVWDFLIDSVFSRYKDGSGTAKAKISHEIIPILAGISDSIVKAHYTNLVAKRLGVPIEAVNDEVQKNRVIKKPPSVTTPTYKREVKDRTELLEDQLLAFAFTMSPGKYLDSETVSLVKSSLNKKLINAYQVFSVDNDSYNASDFFEYLPGELKEHFKILQFADIGSDEGGDTEKNRKEFVLIKKELQSVILRRDLENLAEEMSQLEKNRQKKALKEKEREFSLLTRKLLSLNVND